MKILNTILYLLLAVCLVACDNDEIQFTKGDIPRDIAYKLALKELNVSLEDVDIWATKNKLPANTALKAGANVTTSPNSESWLFFVDELPIVANWGHACKYVFINMNGEVFIQKATMHPNYEQYDMELINVSEARKNYHPSPIKPQAKTKSRSINLLENHYAIILSGGANKDDNRLSYWNDCFLIWDVLTNQYGYDPSKTYVLMSDGTDPGIDNDQQESSDIDFNDDGIVDIVYSTMKQNTDIFFT